MCEYNDEYLSLGIDDGEDKNLHFVFFCMCVMIDGKRRVSSNQNSKS